MPAKACSFEGHSHCKDWWVWELGSRGSCPDRSRGVTGGCSDPLAKEGWRRGTGSGLVLSWNSESGALSCSSSQKTYSDF